MVALNHLMACVTTQTSRHDSYLNQVSDRLKCVAEACAPHIRRNADGDVTSVASLQKSLQDYTAQFAQDNGFPAQLDDAQRAQLEADAGYQAIAQSLEESQEVQESMNTRAQKILGSAHLFPSHLRESISGQAFQQKMGTYLQALGVSDLSCLPKDEAKRLVTAIFQEIVNEAHAKKMAEIWKMIFEMLLQNMRSAH